MNASCKFVFLFGSRCTEGAAEMKNLLGGKGANLAEMCRLGITMPSGFTISTEACTAFTEQGRDAVLALIRAQVLQGVQFVEQEMGKQFGNANDPLLLSVRSGARASMPGMMDTILNLCLNDDAVIGLARKANNERFAWDSYRRFIQMYGDVVMGLKPLSKEEHDPFRAIDQKGVRVLVQIAVEKGRSVRPDIEVGVCGEHGDDPASVAFFHCVGLDYVSCSPYRVPIARLAAAQATLSGD